jgi:hypothetical protein
MKSILVIITILITLTIAGYFILQQNQKESLVPEDMQNREVIPTSEVVNETPDEDNLGLGGNSYLDPNGIFSFLYPNDYQLDTSDPIHPRIYKHGETQSEGTEIYDGVLIVFETVELQGKTLEQWIDDKIRNTPADGNSTVIKPKEATTLNGYPGFTYRVRGLGEYDYIVIQKTPASQYALVITYIAPDPENKGYQKEVDATFSTIELLK